MSSNTNSNSAKNSPGTEPVQADGQFLSEAFDHDERRHLDTHHNDPNNNNNNNNNNQQQQQQGQLESSGRRSSNSDERVLYSPTSSKPPEAEGPSLREYVDALNFIVASNDDSDRANHNNGHNMMMKKKKKNGAAAREGAVAADAENPYLFEAEAEEGPASPPKWYTWLPRTIATLVPYGGLASNCFSLGSMTLGAGIISMPHSFRTSGVLMAVIYLIILNLFTVYSFVLIGYVARRTGCPSYESAGDLLFGQGWGYYVGLMQLLTVTGGSIAFISAIGSLFEALIEGSPSAPDYFRTKNGNRLLVFIVWFCAILPFLLPKKVNSIRYVSTAGVFCIIYFVICLVVHCGMNDCKLGMRGDMKLFTTGNTAVSALSTMIFAYLCQTVAFNLYWEMRPAPSVRQLVTAAAIIMTVITCIYIITGVCGYFDFADATRNPVLLNFDPMHQPYILVAYIGMFIKLVASSAIVMVPIRNYFYYCSGWNVDATPYWLHIPIVTLIGGIILICGLFVPNIGIPFGLVGSICGSHIGFLFPALMWMYCGNFSLRESGLFHVVGCYLMLTVGVIAFVWGTIVTIYDTVKGFS